MPVSIAEGMAEQFRRTLAQLRDIVGKLPDSEWRKGTLDYMIPARLAYHLLFYGHRYVFNGPREAYQAPPCFARRWDELKPDELPSREELLACLELTEAAALAWLSALGDEGLLAHEEAFPWTGDRPLIRAVYNLRHMEWHIGELNALLRERGFEQGKW